MQLHIIDTLYNHQNICVLCVTNIVERNLQQQLSN